MAKRKIKPPRTSAPSDEQKQESEIKRRARLEVIKAKAVNDSFEYDDRAAAPDSKFAEHAKIKTVPELVALLESDKTVQIEARVFFHETKTNIARLCNLGKDKFIEAFRSNKKRTFREAVDSFQMDSGGGNVVGGKDFTPMLGGPFNKQLYYYDYLKMHAQCFYAYNHDPILHAAVQIIRDFALGRDWSVQVKAKDPKQEQQGQALWAAFEEVNDLRMMMYQLCEELSIYGENFIWWLPNNETRIAYQVQPGQEPPKGLIPRVRLIDPSVIWEIVTYPEDIKRVLYYQWVAPTQYQMYTGTDGGKPVPGTKFIYQQLPPDQVDHYKINCRSNEKRGRSDLFAVLGYAKRLRDSVNYSIIGMQKATAWSIDTTIKGSQDDVLDYMEGQKEIGTIPNPGSEFVHTDKIERKYMSNESAGRGNNSNAFDWCFSMICAGLGIPQQYFGTHLSGGSTRASALVATEPVVKKFEMRRNLIEQILMNMATRLFKKFNVDAEIEVTFPELVSQDRSMKLKDLAMAESQGWISKERAAEIAAKELSIMDFDYKVEQERINADPAPAPLFTNPLTTPGSLGGNDDSSRQGTSGQDRKDARDSRGF